MDREPLEHFPRAWRDEGTAPDGRLRPGRGRSANLVGPTMTLIVERLSDYPAMVFSRHGEVLLRTRAATALFGDHTGFGGASRHLVEAGVTGHHHLTRYWHAKLGGLELYRQLLVDPEDQQLLLVFTAVPGSPSDEKLRLLAAASNERAGTLPVTPVRAPGPHTHDEETGMTTREHQLADLYVEMLNTHDPDLVDRFVAEDYRNHNDFVADGREANRRFWTAFFAGLPDVHVAMEDLVVSGDRVVGRFTYRGTHTGNLLGIPATGKPVEMRSIDIWRVSDGMFAEHWDELNLLQMFQRIGVLPEFGGLGAQP